MHMEREGRARVSLPLLIRTLTPSDQGPMLTTSFKLNYVHKGLISKYSHTYECGGPPTSVRDPPSIDRLTAFTMGTRILVMLTP